MRSLILLGLLGLLPALAAVPTKMPEDRDKGRQIWRESCWQCHGWTGEGSGPVAAALPTPSPALAGRVAEEDFDRLIEVIQKGKGDMPAYSAMFDTYDSRRVLVWLASLDKDNPVDEGDAKEQKAAEKAKAKPPRAPKPKGAVEVEEADPTGPVAVPGEVGGGP